jgi:hypothetical protein
VTLRNTPVFNDSYSGPVLFEDEAVGEIICQKFFNLPTGLISVRKPILSNPTLASIAGINENSLDILMGKKIISRDLSITSAPFLTSFEGRDLIGTFTIDAEGVAPSKELILVENGILKNYLNGRTPSLKSTSSSGHKRFALENGGVTARTGPGVIRLTSAVTTDKTALRKKLLDAAKEEDLEYAFIVRKIETPNAGIEKTWEEQSYYFGGNEANEDKSALSKPLYVYKVYVKDGKEELVRGVKIEGLSLRTFKKVTGSSGKNTVYNAMLECGKKQYDSDSWPLYGVPSSIIAPDALLFSELDIVKDKVKITKKLPVVDNPIGQ